MFSSNAFDYINVLDKAADASWKRQELIANNIANVDTPDFKRSDVTFETYLAKELTGRETLSKKVKNISLVRLLHLQTLPYIRLYGHLRIHR